MANIRPLTLQGTPARRKQHQDGDTLLVAAGIASTNSANLVLSGDSGIINLAAGDDLVPLAGDGAIDFSAATGLFKTSTGAVTVGPGAVTVSGVTTFTAAGTAVTVDNDMLVSGNLTVSGTTTTVDSENVLIADNHMLLNAGYTADAAQSGGIAVNYDPTTTTDSSSVAAPTATTITTAGSGTFAAGDYVLISGGNVNDGLVRVASHTGTTLTIATSGDDSTIITTSLDTVDTTAMTLTKTAIGVMRCGTDGIWETASGSTGPLTFTDLGTGSGDVSVSGTPVDNQLAVWVSASAIEGDANLTWDGSALGVTGTADFSVPDNTADAFLVQQGTDDYIAVATTDSSEDVSLGNATTNPTIQLLGTGQKTIAGNLDATGGLDVTGGNFTHASGGTGNVDVSWDFSGGIVNSAGELLVSGGNVQLNDSIALTLGTGDDVSLSFDGSDTLLTAAAGGIVVTTVDGAGAFIVQAAGGEDFINLNTTAASEAIVLGNATTNPDITQLGSGQVSFSGNVDASAGLDVSGAALTSSGGLTLTSVGITMTGLDIGGAGAEIGDIYGDGFIRLAESADPTNVADKGFFYAKDVATITEAFYMDSAGNAVQLTSGGSIAAGASGDATYLTGDADEAINAFALCTTAVTGANGEIVNCDHSTESNDADAMGFAIAAASAGASVSLQMDGEVTVPDSQWDVAPGASDGGKPVYASTTAGKISLTAPTGDGQVVQQVGKVSFADASADTSRVAVRIYEPTVLEV